MCGSSPLARGTWRGARRCVPLPRLIPARAGNISIRSSIYCVKTAHPRSRGEHTGPKACVHAGAGSSPLARGTLIRSTASPARNRLIPARAGNIIYLWIFRFFSSAHPRSRGEHTSRSGGMSDVLGSSPLARGTYCASICGLLSGRLIPARAGNIPGRTNIRRRRTAHPRSRGEHTPMVAPSTSPRGSSPLARGTCRRNAPSRRAGRLIPARAGNIAPRHSLWAICAAHPRSRGEHASPPPPAASAAGSSPLARGTCRYTAKGILHVRLIPARAGNILADMGVYPLHQQNRITLKPEPHPGYTINSHS